MFRKKRSHNAKKMDHVKSKITEFAQSIAAQGTFEDGIVFPYNQKKNQLFPYKGRRQNAPVRAVLDHFNPKCVVDPFAGSGIFPLVFHSIEGLNWKASEWAPGLHRLASAPWRVPEDKERLSNHFDAICAQLEPLIRPLYTTQCSDCGADVVWTSFFFIGGPPEVRLSTTANITHERSGPNGRSLIHRGAWKCTCGNGTSLFDAADEALLQGILAQPLSQWMQDRLGTQLIYNTRINLNQRGITTQEFFVPRSLRALDIIRGVLEQYPFTTTLEKEFFRDVWLTCLNDARRKDAQSSTQQMFHRPPQVNRETNVFEAAQGGFKYRFNQRFKVLYSEEYPQLSLENPESVIACKDFRAFFDEIQESSVSMILTDPPWTDGEPYFESDQFWGPWLPTQHVLSTDADRLAGEIVVSNSPDRNMGMPEWRASIREFFQKSSAALEDFGLLVLYTQGVVGNAGNQTEYLRAYNDLRLAARANGFEPIRRIAVEYDVEDPNMRQAQGAFNVFGSKEVLYFFVKKPIDQHEIYVLDKGEPASLEKIALEAANQLYRERGYRKFNKKMWWYALLDRCEKQGLGPDVIQQVLEHRRELQHRVLQGWLLYSPRRHSIPTSLHVRCKRSAEEFFRIKRSSNSSFSYVDYIWYLSEQISDEERGKGNEFLSQMALGYLNWRCEQNPTTGLYSVSTQPRPSLPNNTSHPRNLPGESNDPNVYDYVDFCMDLLEKMGYTEIIRTPNSGDENRDIEATDEFGRRGVIEVKNHRNSIDRKPVQGVEAYRSKYGFEWAMIMSNSNLTGGRIGGQKWADDLGVTVWSGSELYEMVSIFWPSFPN